MEGAAFSTNDSLPSSFSNLDHDYYGRRKIQKMINEGGYKRRVTDAKCWVLEICSRVSAPTILENVNNGCLNFQKE